jgi:photosystem II protein
MKTYIYFLKSNLLSVKEKTLPIVKLTRSKNGETGTATFIFIKPTIFNQNFLTSDTIEGMHLIWGNDKEIKTEDIKIFFKYGKPFLLKSIFIFKNSVEWFNFITFMKSYSKETGLLFSENNLFS